MASGAEKSGADAAAMMKACIAQEQQRNNAGKAAAELACKEKSEAQREVDRAPSDKPAPGNSADGMSHSGHSSHSRNSSSSPPAAPPAK
jgi:hypothetical protein